MGDVTKFVIAKNGDDTLTFRSDGWPDLKLQKKALRTKADLSGEYDGSVPFILDMVLKFPGDGTVDFDQNVKVASTEIKCPTEKIAETDAEITFPDAPKFVISKDSEESITFKSDGWPDFKLKKKALR